jgi:hypothetical protein
LLNFLLIPAASVVFYFKKRRMPECHFTINGEQIKRVTQDGVLEIPWTDVVAVHSYTQGYMVQKLKGAVPLPYRCLTKTLVLPHEIVLPDASRVVLLERLVLVRFEGFI